MHLGDRSLLSVDEPYHLVRAFLNSNCPMSQFFPKGIPNGRVEVERPLILEEPCSPCILKGRRETILVNPRTALVCH